MISTNDRLLPNEHLDSVRVVYHKRSSSYYFFFLSSRWTINCFSGLVYNIKNLFRYLVVRRCPSEEVYTDQIR